MTDDTRDRDRPFADGGESPEATSDDRQRRSPSFGRAERTPTGTAGSARSTADGPSVAGSERAPSEDTSTGPNAERGARPNPERATSPNTESNDDRLEERLRAVERALTGTDDPVADLGDEASASAEREELSTRLDDLEARVEELEAATQAIRGYVGSIRSVNQAVERRADLALAKASENADAAATDEPSARDTADGDATGNATANDSLDAGVPSEADLDAAVPSERRRGSGAGSAVERSETDDEKPDDSWRADALDRLRESL